MAFKRFACALAWCCWAMSANAAGIQLLDRNPSLAGAIWYPCGGTPADVPLGKLSVGPVATLPGVNNCPVTGAKLPLIVFSHGRGGYFGANHDTAEALADAGFIVAAINHPGDNGNDSSQRDSLSVLGSRPTDMVRLLDFMLHDWKDRAVIDPARNGIFGFSLGGYTSFVLVGVKPDFGRIASFCKETTGACAELHNGVAPPNPPHDERIKAAVIVDPATGVITEGEVAAIKVPLQYWRSERGGPGVGDGSGTLRVAGGLPAGTDIHVMPAGHFTFLAPCSPQLAATTAMRRVCTDNPPDFDRAAFHRAFNASVVQFFRDHLTGVR